MTKFFTATFVTVMLFSTPVFAASAGPQWVYDPKNLAELEQEYNELSSQYDELTRMYSSLGDIHNDGLTLHQDLNGLFKINGQSVGAIYNNIGQGPDTWKWSANTWDDALQGLAGGNEARYQQLKDQYKQYYPNVISQNEFEKGSTPAISQAYAQMASVNQAAMTQSAYQFEDLNNRLTEIQNLSTQIGSATSEKEALDLNSKIAAQQAYLQVEMLRMSSLANQQIGQMQANTLQGQAAASQMNDDYLPTN